MFEDRPKSSAEQDIENTMENVQEDSVRYAVLDKARFFKSSWVELGEVLAKVAKAKSYQSWGYKSLEAYCLKELHIRRVTVAKLIGNYHFLSRNEPEMMQKEQINKLPDFDTLNVLAKARENNIDQETYDQLKNGAINKGFSATTLTRKLKEANGTEEVDPQKKLQKRISSLASSIRLLFLDKGEVPQQIKSALSQIESYLQEQKDTEE